MSQAQMRLRVAKIVCLQVTINQVQQNGEARELKRSLAKCPSALHGFDVKSAPACLSACGIKESLALELSIYFRVSLHIVSSRIGSRDPY